MQAGYPQAESNMAARAHVPTDGQGGVSNVRPQAGGVAAAQMARPITGSTAQVMQQAQMAGGVMPLGMQQRPTMGATGQPMMMAGQQQQVQQQQRFGQPGMPVAGTQQAFKYTPNTRNIPQQQAQYQQQMMQQQSIRPQQQPRMMTVHSTAPSTSTMDDKGQPQEQKQTLAEQLLPLVEQSLQRKAQKITRLLLEKDEDELLKMLENGDLLDAKINQALLFLHGDCNRSSSKNTGVDSISCIGNV